MGSDGCSVIDPALIAIAAVTLAGLALWHRFFLSLMVSLFLPVWQRPRQQKLSAPFMDGER
jgi:hypothetical protein